MVKRLVNTGIIILFAVWLMIYKWPDSKADVLSTLALIVFSVAAGVVLSNLCGGARNGKEK